MQERILHLCFEAKGGGYRLETVFASLGVAEGAVKRRERDRAFEPVVAGAQAPQLHTGIQKSPSSLRRYLPLRRLSGLKHL